MQRLLIWMGDLSRYKIDLGLDDDPLLARRFYQQVWRARAHVRDYERGPYSMHSRERPHERILH